MSILINKTTLLFVAFYYLTWGRIYRFFERSKYKTKSDPDFSQKDVKDRWESICNTITYKEDTAKMLWDVLSDPKAVISRGYGDCDDYAGVAAKYLGKQFTMNNNEYRFLGIYMLVFNKAPHHTIAVWESKKNIAAVSTQLFRTYDNHEKLYVYHYENDQYIKYAIKCDVSSEPVFNVKFMGIDKIPKYE